MEISGKGYKWSQGQCFFCKGILHQRAYRMECIAEQTHDAQHTVLFLQFCRVPATLYKKKRDGSRFKRAIILINEY